jgi:hypothetical protein
MAATKKTIPRKAKTSVKKSAVKVAAPSSRAPRKQYTVAAGAAAAGRETFTLVLASLFTILSVLFAIISYWRYHL